MKPEDSSHVATKRMIEQVNNVSVSKEDLIEAVQEIGELDPEERDFTGHAITIVRLHSGEPEKVKAIMFRLEALARLLAREGAPGWTLALPNEAVLTQEPVFAAAAVQPMIEQNGRVAFERDSFLQKVLDMADLERLG